MLNSWKLQLIVEAIPFQHSKVIIIEAYTSLQYAIVFHISCNLVSSNNNSQIVEKSAICGNNYKEGVHLKKKEFILSST